MRARRGPLVRVSVEYYCEGCHYADRVRHEDGTPLVRCTEPGLVRACDGIAQFTGNYNARAPSFCPFRDDDDARPFVGASPDAEPRE